MILNQTNKYAVGGGVGALCFGEVERPVDDRGFGIQVQG
jgi:hypothetical protein